MEVKLLFMMVTGAVVFYAGAWTIHRSFRNGYPAGAQGVASRQSVKGTPTGETALVSRQSVKGTPTGETPVGLEKLIGTGSHVAPGTGPRPVPEKGGRVGISFQTALGTDSQPVIQVDQGKAPQVGQGAGSQSVRGINSRVGLIECVAHRGYWNAEIPENTVEAIRRAYDCGANWVETDFNLEPDGRMLCYHDPKRRDEVIKPPFHVPTVDEVLAVVPKDRGIQCEIKRYGRGYAEKFDRAVCAAGLSEKNVIVSSFDEAALRDFKKRKPSYRTLYLTGVTAATTPESLIAKGRSMGVFSICPGAAQAKAAGWTAAKSDKIRAAGFSFRFWGVNTPELLAYAAEVKAKAFTCNFFEEAFRWADEAGVALIPPTVVPSL